MAILDLSDSAYIVAENVVPTLKTVRGFFQLLEDVGFDEQKRRFVLNRFSSYAGSPSLAEVERYVGQNVDHVIPWDKKFVLAANVGQPLLSSKFRWNKSFKALNQIVESIESDAQKSESTGYSTGYETNSEPDGFSSEMRSTNDREGV